MLKTLFLQPPTFDGFDGGAGSRYQAKREIDRRPKRVRFRLMMKLPEREKR